MAAVIESWFRQDLQTPVKVHYLNGNLFSNNGNGNRIGVELTNNGEDYTVTGTVSGYAVLADGSTVPCTGAKSGNKASILVPPAAYLPGNIFITIFLTDGTTVTTLAAVSSTVMQARTDNQVSPGSVVTDWTNTINAAMQSVETAAANLGKIVATPYAQLTFPVPLGKYTYYNNNLYRCTTPIASSEDFTAAHWSSALNLGDEVSDLKSALSPLSDIATVWKNGTPFNNSNSYYISNKYVLPTNGASEIEVIFDMSLNTGDRSKIFLYTFNIDSGSTDQSGNNRIRNEVSEFTTDGHVTFALQREEKGFAIAVGRIDSNGDSISVRLNNIDTNKIRLLKSFNWNIDEIYNDINYKFVDLVNVYDGSSGNPSNTVAVCTGGYGRTGGLIPVGEGDKYIVKVKNKLLNPTDYYAFGYAIYSTNTNPPTLVRSIDYGPTKTFENVFPIEIRSGENYLAITVVAYDENGNSIPLRNTGNLAYTKNDITLIKINNSCTDNVQKIANNAQKITKLKTEVNNPAIASIDMEWRNGSAFNMSNQNYISPYYIIPSMGANKVVFYADIDLNEGEKVNFYFCSFNISSGRVDQSGNNRIRNDVNIRSSDKIAIFDIDEFEKGFVIYISKVDSEGTVIPLRKANVDTSKLRMVRYYFTDTNSSEEELTNIINNARHIPGRNVTIKPLTILHFSDLHADTAALKRIIAKSGKYSELIDDAICTGDIVANNYGSITSWWDSSVMTCIGNHDSASYSEQSGYNWTYLTMAQRSQYYIEPFEANWGIVHTPGTSYYYKDYPDSKVRLIVMDAMLYTGESSTAEATAQNAWLSALMDETLNSNNTAYGFHVLIAIHAPHGGATPVDCTFSKRQQGTMPTYTDCNTPQSVVDIVATKISAGCKFVGYLVGHTHQDDIWDCENDGKQRMYCITCAAVANANQWKASDQHRDENMDAFNIVTIDTVNGLVKIIRGGGANSDYCMRNRKQIGFYYPSGAIIGQDN